MKEIKIFSALGLLAMTAVLFYAFSTGNFFSDGGELLSNPWGIVSLVDLYVGFILFSLWIVYREKHLYMKIIWVSLMMVLGFFTGSLYMLMAAYQSKGDVKKFWLGKHY